MNGIINYYKEPGLSSFGAVAYIRKLFGLKKVGHIGTLDPLAEGVLPICIGNATKFVDKLMSAEKVYLAEMQLGIQTDSFDITGKELNSNSDTIPNKEDIENILNSMIGEIELIVPSFSAKKINGVRAYKLARAGKIDNAGTAMMLIKSIELVDYNYPIAKIRVDCGKGTYIRSIINQVGINLGSFATMSKLIRLENGKFNVGNSLKREDLDLLKDENRLSESLIDIRNILTDWHSLKVIDRFLPKLKNGIAPSKDDFIDFSENISYNHIFIEDSLGNLHATAMVTGSNIVKLINVF